MTSNRMQVILNHLQGPKSNATKETSTRPYKYTLDNNLLTDEQRAFYEINGYLLIPKLINHDLLDECRDRFLDLCNHRVEKGNMILMKEKSLAKTNAVGERLYYKVQDFVWDDVLSKYLMDPLILDYVQCFTGPDIKAVHSMLINKPPDSGKMTSQHPLHQDLHYFPFRPAERIVASWTAMERITKDNGCLFVFPGTHKAALQPHTYPESDVNKAFHGIQGYELMKPLYVLMEKGDTIFFHPQLFHGSGPNITNGFRKAISGHYASSHCYYINVEGTTQQNIKDEILEIAKKRGIDVSYEDGWRYRSRLVRGNEGTL